ncbi:hypothetical protein J2Y03_005585 [Neobacillus niacini]|nr:hypothetical protein [Neobacillus niacini]
MDFWMVLILRRIPKLYPYFLFILGIIVIGRFLYKDYADYFDLAFIIILLLQTIYLYQRKKSKRHQR